MLSNVSDSQLVLFLDCELKLRGVHSAHGVYRDSGTLEMTA
jgi:hypothetical protein